MGYVLGLDLGSNSIGWALVDEVGERVLRSGVRVFPEGVDRDKQGGEVSKNENRRIKRGMRRQIFRKARRKRKLRAALVEAGLLPAEGAEQLKFDGVNPYALRAKGLDQRLEKIELGRVLLHLNQRRGFKSNRKGGKTKEEKGMLAEISMLARKIADSGSRTLGEYLHREIEAGGVAVRIRGQHTRREMLEEEFGKVWEKQQEFYPGILTDELRGQLWDELIAFQRAMYWPKSAVGRCELEPRERRCRREHRVAQRFRMYHEVNNLRVVESRGRMRPLTADERAKLIAYLSASKERTFDEIRKHLGMLDSQGFNLEFGDRRKMLGLSTDYLLSGKKYFGKTWGEIPEEKKNRIVNAILDEGMEEATFKKLAMEEWGADANLADALLEVELKEGYASYGMPAMLRLLPFLEQGFPLSAKTGERNALHEAGYLRGDEQVVHQKDYLPEPPELTNPLVRQALYQVRQLVNGIIKEYGKPAAIHVELAREVKGTAEQRAKQSWEMREREQYRAAVAERIGKELGIRPRRSDIERYLLWEEQGKMCMYCGEPISLAQLFGGDVDVDHILPYPRSLDDSRMNKVVVFRSENQAKGDRTPFEWLAATDPDKYEQVLQRAAKLPLKIRNAKRLKFSVETLELTEFIERQLNDTKYITRKVAEYVECLGVDIVCTKGACTSDLRHFWGLDTVLRGDGLALKNREDHRHHAVDAVVIALTDRRRLQALARMRQSGEALELPWEDFRLDVEGSINAINVSHRVERRVSGALHEETLYGPTAKAWKGGAETRRDVDGVVKERPWATGWVEEEGAFSYRKPLAGLTAAMVPEIRDRVVRDLVADRLKAHGVEPDSNKAIPVSVWKEPLCMPSGTVIKKVRLIRRDETIKPIRSGQACVKTGSNHHVCIFEFEERGKKKREGVWVSMMEAARRVRDKETIIRREHPTRKGAKFVMSMSRGEMVEAVVGGVKQLMVYRTAASTTGQMSFVLHTDARPDIGVKKYKPRPSTLDARKVTVDLLGRIRWAND